MNETLTQDRLKELVSYNPTTGIFTRLVKTCNRTKKGSHPGSKSNTDGYLYFSILNKKYAAHRLAWFYVHGYFPENEIDHINRSRTDNRIINLREVTRSCNLRNSNIRKDNKSGITGVRWEKTLNKWRVKIKIKDKHKHLGVFRNKIDAAKARWDAEKKYGWPNCNTISTAYMYLKENGGL